MDVAEEERTGTGRAHLGRLADKESGQWLLRVNYDPAWGRYRYTWDIDVRKLDPGLMECFNLDDRGRLRGSPGKTPLDP